MDRFFDNYVMTAMQKPVSEALRAEATRKEEAMAEARQATDTAYAWLEERLSGRTWAAGGTGRWPIAPQRHRSSTPIGSTRSAPIFHDCGTIVRACWRGRPSRAP